jgi:hypothetical protein
MHHCMDGAVRFNRFVRLARTKRTTRQRHQPATPAPPPAARPPRPSMQGFSHACCKSHRPLHSSLSHSHAEHGLVASYSMSTTTHTHSTVQPCRASDSESQPWLQPASQGRRQSVSSSPATVGEQEGGARSGRVLGRRGPWACSYV